MDAVGVKIVRLTSEPIVSLEIEPPRRSSAFDRFWFLFQNTFRHAVVVNVVGVVFRDLSSSIPNECRREREEQSQWQGLQPLDPPHTPFLFLRMPNQLVRQYVKQFGDDFQKIVSTIRPLPLEKIGGCNFRIPQSRRIRSLSRCRAA